VSVGDGPVIPGEPSRRESVGDRDSQNL